MKDAPSVESAHAFDVGKPVHHSRGDEQRAGRQAPAARENDLEARRRPARVPRFASNELDPVFCELAPPDPEQLSRPDAVARQKTVERLRGRVARAPRVAEEHAAPAPAEDERGREPRRSPTDDDRVVAGRATPRHRGVGGERRSRDPSRSIFGKRNSGGRALRACTRYSSPVNR